MKHPIKYALAFQLGLTLLQAQVQIKPEMVCGVPHISAIPPGTPMRLQRLAKSGALTFKIRKNMTSQDVGHIEVEFTPLYSDANFEIYGETEQINSGRILAADVDTLVQIFRDATPSSSIDSTMGIKAIAESIFGNHPDVNGDGKMVILLLDVRDDFEEGVSESFVAGYFDIADQLGNEANNQDIIYLDTFPGNLSGSGAKELYSTLAHEYQHLIHYSRDSNEHSWVNEGLSELSPVLMGLPHRSFSHYLSNTNIALTHFTGSLADYARSALFFLYSWIQLGTPFIQDLIANTNGGILGFTTTLPSHTALTFGELVQNWHLANFIQGSGPIGYGPDWSVPIPLMHKSLYSFPATVSATVSAYSAHWTLVSHASNLVLTGSNSENAVITLFKGEDRSPVDGSGISAGGFTDADYGVTYTDLYVLNATAGLTSIYNLDAEAEGNLEEFTRKYDNNLSVFEQQFIAFGDLQAVVEFNVPSNSVDLTTISFLAFNSNPVQVRLYADVLNSSNLIFLDTISASYQLQWSPHRLPVGLGMAGRTIFVGLTGVALAYNEAHPQQWSYLGETVGSNFAALDSFSLDGINPLVGNWAVRVSYLIPGLEPVGPVAEMPVGDFYANPFFHDGTLNSVVRLDVNHESAVDFRIYNILGQQIWKTTRAEGNSAPIAWRGITNAGRPVPSGVYFAVIRVGSVIQKRKLLLIR